MEFRGCAELPPQLQQRLRGGGIDAAAGKHKAKRHKGTKCEESKRSHVKDTTHGSHVTWVEPALGGVLLRSNPRNVVFSLSHCHCHSHSCLLLRWRFSAPRDDRWTWVILVRENVCRNKNWGSPGRWCCYVTSQTEVHFKMCPRGGRDPRGHCGFYFFNQFFSPFQTPKKNLF